MTIEYQTCPAIMPAPHTGVVQRIAGGLSRLWKAHRNRRQVAALSSFNERMLRDIGLTSADVDFALQQSLWSDPSEHLVKASDSRKRYRFRRSG